MELHSNLSTLKIGVVDKEGKKLRPYRHGTLETKDVTNPINVCCNAKETEPRVKIGEIFQQHENYMRDYRIDCPGAPIDQ